MKKIITITGLVLIILFSSCKKHKEWKDLETININNIIKRKDFCYLTGAMYLQNNKLMGIGISNCDSPPGDTKVVGKLVKIGPNIILSDTHEEKATESEKKLPDSFHSKWKTFSKMSAKVNSDIKKLLPKHLKIRYVYREDLNSDGKKDYFLFATTPGNFSTMDIYTIIILSHNNKYFLQYLDFWETVLGSRLIDITTVNLFNDNRKYIAVRYVQLGGKGYSASFDLYWIE